MADEEMLFSDDNEEFFGGDDVEVEEEAGPCGKVVGAMQMCMLGICLFPIMLFICGWNEKNYVCTDKLILYVEANAKEVGCEVAKEEELAFYSCPLEEDSLKNFTPSVWDSPGGNDWGAAITFKSTAAKQENEVYQCIEHKETVEKDEKKYTKYSYSMEWRSDIAAYSTYTSHASLSKIQQGCRGFTGIAPSLPKPLAVNPGEEYAGEVKAGAHTINKHLMSMFPLDTYHDLSSVAADFGLTTNATEFAITELTPSKLTVCAGPSGQPNTALCTCIGAPELGCVRISWKKSAATFATVIAKEDAAGSQDAEIPSSWMCSASKYARLFDAELTMEKAIETLHSENSNIVWLLRIIGLLGAWGAVYCCLAPIATAADLVGDCLDMIPCIGGYLEDFVEGVVDTILCFISCSFGCSCALFVMAVVWFVMRPLYGGLLLLVVFLLIGCAVAAGNMAPKKEAGRRRRRKSRVADGEMMDMEG
eukprot:gnl/TRDRNA2_/TRDRNA2_171670_c0_seq3.p1 gnl/TRDRNA2_/TRDRNA2_171670_c0~~gnl/TRDRNA2_/TRDRNA2_171670_c0_seq3.p1  ORF type:complete len:477 (-),score=94.13 gnl/TRDRNA2_/TRDRNA2_171670_c0_seq3:278-1708(-)